jgi:hypothetical protein
VPSNSAEISESPAEPGRRFRLFNARVGGGISRTFEGSLASAAAELANGVSSHSENSENVTNEPKVDEKAFIAKPSGTVEVAANSALDSGLDSLGSFVPRSERRHGDGPRPCHVAANRKHRECDERT